MAVSDIQTKGIYHLQVLSEKNAIVSTSTKGRANPNKMYGIKDTAVNTGINFFMLVNFIKN